MDVRAGRAGTVTDAAQPGSASCWPSRPSESATAIFRLGAKILPLRRPAIDDGKFETGSEEGVHNKGHQWHADNCERFSHHTTVGACRRARHLGESPATFPPAARSTPASHEVPAEAEEAIWTDVHHRQH